MNILDLNTNSMINEDRRRKFSAAVIGGGFLAACVSETGFIQISLLKNFFSGLMSFIEPIGPLEKRTYLLRVDHLLLYLNVFLPQKLSTNYPSVVLQSKLLSTTMS